MMESPQDPAEGSVAPFLSSPISSIGNCQQHPESEAIAVCKNCSVPVCATCDFQFPGGLHFCPTCATKTTAPLSSSRKTMLGWSFLCAVWVSIFLTVTFAGAFVEVAEQEPAATIIGTLILVPALVGLALSLGSMDSRAGNPAVVWVAVVWNSLLTGVWIILCFVGLTMQ